MSTGLWPAPAPFSAGAARGSETVLVVEDEPGVRRLIVSLLELHGYRVLVASNASEALQVAAAHSGRIDLLLTDLQMPDMNGRELAQRLGVQRPEMRLLYMSGQSVEEVTGHGVLASGALFLAKPFSVAALTRRVRDVLDDPVR